MGRFEGKILITGSNGQLGQCIKYVVDTTKINKDRYIFSTREDFDIGNKEMMRNYLQEHNDVKMIINCAAYTNVKDCETEEGFKKAMFVNCESVKNLANLCNEFGIFLIHFGTDYMYKTEYNKPIDEDKIQWTYSDDYFIKYYGTGNINKYGYSKLMGVHEIFKEMFPREEPHYEPKFLIIVVSWLFSEYGKNFVKTIRERLKLEEQTKVIYTQIGSPTYALDLAFFLFNIIEFFDGKFFNNDKYHYNLTTISKRYWWYILNYANTGVASWYDLAKVIEDYFYPYTDLGKEKIVPTDKPIDNVYRPPYSVLNLSKAYKLTKENFNWELRHWNNALLDCCKKIAMKENFNSYQTIKNIKPVKDEDTKK